MTDDQLFRFVCQLVVLFLAARLGAEIATRLGVPANVGEILAGVVLGPSVLGVIWPGAFSELFPDDPSSRVALDVVAWFGVILLVTIAGLETRPGVLRNETRVVVGSWLGGFGLPFVAGFALGMLFPGDLVPTGISQPLFATFLATAMSISAIPVIARILLDLGVYATRLGMVIIASATADDTVGWIILSVVVGLAGEGVEAGVLIRTIALTLAFVIATIVVGRPAVKFMVRRSSSLRIPYPGLSVMLLIVLAFGAFTQAIGAHLVLGSFAAAILIGRSRPDDGAVRAIRQMAFGFFVPVFFAYTGARTDLTALDSESAGIGVLAVSVAVASKLIGGGLGARLGGLPRYEALAVGIGLNARGAIGLVMASIGLSAGLLTDATYAILVLIAIATTLMTPPLLRACIARMDPPPVHFGGVLRRGNGGATELRSP